MRIPKLFCGLFLSGFTVFFLSSFVFPKTDPETKQIIRTEKIIEAMNSSLEEDSSDIGSIAVFLYASDFEEIYLLSSNDDLKSSQRFSIKDDIVLQNAYDRHKNKICYFGKQTPSLYWKSLGQYWSSGTGFFFFSCPLFDEKGILIGFIATAGDSRQSNFPDSFFRIQYLKIEIEQKIKQII